jgi:hypothetical protein
VKTRTNQFARLCLGVTLALAFVATGCAAAPNPAENGGQAAAPAGHTLASGDEVTQPLNAAEREGILFMREEEKLARDVYLTLGEMWSTNTFKNIAQSEQTHMDEVLLVINKYGLTDPVKDNDIGVFENATLQTLYDELIARGSESEIEALNVGAAIEEIDIIDLEEYLQATNNTDIVQVYGDLLSGSMKHLQSFTSVLSKRGVEYEPQYLSRAEYDELLASELPRGGEGHE